MTGYVYAMANEAGSVKIGYSANPLRRLEQIGYAEEGKVELLGVARGTKRHEREAHDLFEKWRERGEWFRFEGPVKAFVEMLGPPTTDLERLDRESFAEEFPVFDKIGGWPVLERILNENRIKIPPSNTLKKWRVRGMPYKVRTAVMLAFARSGIRLSENDFISTKAKGRAA